MPTYEYACSACSRRLEVFQRFSEDPLVECQECGGDLRRVFHPVGILFKGSGFYSTDARAKSSSKANGSSQDSDSKKKSDTGSSGSAERAKGTAETPARKSEAKGSEASQTKGSKDS